MENLDRLKSLIKRHGAISNKPTMTDLYNVVMREYCSNEPLTNQEKSHIGNLAWEMICNFYGMEEDDAYNAL